MKKIVLRRWKNSSYWEAVYPHGGMHVFYSFEYAWTSIWHYIDRERNNNRWAV